MRGRRTGRTWVCMGALWGGVACAATWAETNEAGVATGTLDTAIAGPSKIFQPELSVSPAPRPTASAPIRPEDELLGLQYAQSLETVLMHLDQARARELTAMQQAHRATLITVGIMAGVGFLVILLLALAGLRTLNRRVESALGPPVNWPVSETGQLALRTGGAELAVRNPAQAATQRLSGALNRLEQRIRELESGPQPRPAPSPQMTPTPGEELSPAPTPVHTSASVLIARGELLVGQHDYEAALRCFEEAVEVAPEDAELFVKRGTALERLGRLEEAMASYDRAITLDKALTSAYLHKGGIYSRLERYGEALDCYEKALGARKPSGDS